MNQPYESNLFNTMNIYYIVNVKKFDIKYI